MIKIAMTATSKWNLYARAPSLHAFKYLKQVIFKFKKEEKTKRRKEGIDKRLFNDTAEYGA